MGIQFISTIINKQSIDNSKDFIIIYEVPKGISTQLKTSCYDCHSTNTIYPWYSNIQPMNILLSKHINDGKEELNLSVVETYSKSHKKRVSLNL